MKSPLRLALPLLLSASLLCAGCKTQGQTGAATGAVLGAAAGQLIGGDTEGTLLGAAIGAGAGYMVGNERDKAAAREQDAQQAAQSQRQQDPSSGGQVGEASTGRPSPLTGSRWKVVSLEAAEPTEYASKLVDFTATSVTTTTTHKDGKVETTHDDYRIVGDALVVTRPGEVINAQFNLSGNTLIINCNQFRAVLERL